MSNTFLNVELRIKIITYTVAGVLKTLTLDEDTYDLTQLLDHIKTKLLAQAVPITMAYTLNNAKKASMTFSPAIKMVK